MAAEFDLARVQNAVDQYAVAMESTDRAGRLCAFERAEQMFRQIVEGDEDHAGIQNADLYANLGNAALQAERIGPAVVAYRRALEMVPQHAQARQNLAYARSLLPEWIRRDETHGLFNSLFFWRSLLTVGQMHVWGAVCFLCAAIVVGVGILKSQPLLRNLAVVPLLGWGIIMVSLLLDPAESSAHNVVVVQESAVYSADSENSPPRLSKPLPSGAELSLVQFRERWSEVELPDGRTGWVLSSSIERPENSEN